jgi:hypothetical protein
MSKAKDVYTTVGKRYTAKLKDRRVSGILMKDGTISYRFKRLMSDNTIRYDSIRLSPEAVTFMFRISCQVLRDDIEGVNT